MCDNPLCCIRLGPLPEPTDEEIKAMAYRLAERIKDGFRNESEIPVHSHEDRESLGGI